MLQQNDIKVKYAVKAFTDINETDSVYTHGLYISKGTNNDRSLLYKAGHHPGDEKNLNSIPIDWYLTDTSYTSSSPLQWEIGPKTLVKTYADLDQRQNKEVKCMYWTKPEYQSKLCALDVESDETVFFIDGVLTKQKSMTQSFPHHIQSLPFFHFQEWKRYYRDSQISPLMHFADMGMKGLVLTPDGVLPILPIPSRKNRSKFNVDDQVNRWYSSTFVENKMELPTSKFCLRSSARNFPPTPLSSECIDYGENYFYIPIATFILM